MKTVGKNALIHLKGYLGEWPLSSANRAHFHKKSQKLQGCELDSNQNHFADGLRLDETHVFLVKTELWRAALRFKSAQLSQIIVPKPKINQLLTAKWMYSYALQGAEINV